MVTIAERIQENSRRLNKWLEENPGVELGGGRKRDGKIDGGFVPVLHDMIDGAAYKKLTNAARTAYTLLKRQVKQGGQ